MGMDKRGRADKKAKKLLVKRLAKHRARRDFELKLRDGDFVEIETFEKHHKGHS